MHLIKNNKKILVDYLVEVQSCVHDINKNIYREIDFLGFDNITDVLRISQNGSNPYCSCNR